MATVAEAGPSASSRTQTYEPRAPLVNQVDAESLDDGIAQMLGENIERVICRWTPSMDFRPEIELTLKLACFAVGVLGPSAASPGAALQNLRLASSRTTTGRPTRSSLLLYLVLTPSLLPRYLITRARSAALSRSWPDLPAHDRRKKLWNLIVRLETASRAWELAGWAMFLWDGKYPSLLMRALGLRLVPSAPRLARMVSYEYMNRQLVWGVITEFLMFAIPRIPSLPSVVNPATLVQPVKAFLSQPTTIDYQALSDAHTASSAARKAGAPAPKAAHAGALAAIPTSTCPVCYLRRTSANIPLPGTDIELPQLAAMEEEQMDHEDRIFVPAATDCWGECHYCYYCIADELAQHAQRTAEEGTAAKWTCLRCGGGVTRAKRAGADPLPVSSAAGTSEEESESSGTEPASSSEGERLGESWQDLYGSSGTES